MLRTATNLVFRRSIATKRTETQYLKEKGSALEDQYIKKREKDAMRRASRKTPESSVRLLMNKYKIVSEQFYDDLLKIIKK